MNQDKEKTPGAGTPRANDPERTNNMNQDTNSGPIKPGQAVRSELDGTLGVTTSIRNRHGWISVMFVGAIGTTKFRAYELSVVDLVEAVAA